MDLYSIGEMVIDFIPGQEASSYLRSAGGAPANVAIAARRNGLDTGMCCSVGGDDFGRFLMATLAENNVQILNPRLCDEAITTMAFVTLEKEGERSFIVARKPGADMFLREEDVKESDIRTAVIVHGGSCSLSAEPVASATMRALRLGRALDKLVSFDVNYRSLMWNDNQAACTRKVLEAFPYVDLLKISEEEVGMFGGEKEIPALMQQYRITLTVETLGAHGARCFFRGRSFEISGRKAHAVDATGAGDAFWGGFLSSLRLHNVERAEQLTEAVIRRAMEYGNIAGWLCVQQKGAIASLPNRSEIERFLA